MYKSIIRIIFTWTILLTFISNVFGSINVMYLFHGGGLYIQKEKGKKVTFLSHDAIVYDDPKQDIIYIGEENKYVPIFRKAMGLIYIHDFLIFYTKNQFREELLDKLKDIKISRKIIKVLTRKFNMKVSYILSHIKSYIVLTDDQEDEVERLIEDWNRARYLFDNLIIKFIRAGLCQYHNKILTSQYIRCSKNITEFNLFKNDNEYVMDIARSVINDYYRENPAIYLSPSILAELNVKVPFIATSFYSKIVLCEHHRILAAKYLRIPIAVNIVPPGTSFN